MSNVQKAYDRGYRMGEYIRERDGIEMAHERGSKAEIIYAPRMRGLIWAYDRGYKAALGEQEGIMTKYEAAKQIIREMADNYDSILDDLGAEMDALKRDFTDNKEAIMELREDRRIVDARRDTLKGLLATLDERVSLRVNGII